jgi:hypothetical protein
MNGSRWFEFYSGSTVSTTQTLIPAGHAACCEP